MTKKICLYCKKEFEPSKFTKNWQIYCRDCKNIKKPKDKRNQREKHTEYVREWRKKNPEKAKEYERINARRKFTNPEERKRARVRAATRKKMSELKGNSKCYFCDSDNKKLDFHHVSYKDVEDVVTLCVDCHKKYHRLVRDELKTQKEKLGKKPTASSKYIESILKNFRHNLKLIDFHLNYLLDKDHDKYLRVQKYYIDFYNVYNKIKEIISIKNKQIADLKKQLEKATINPFQQDVQDANERLKKQNEELKLRKTWTKKHLIEEERNRIIKLLEEIENSIIGEDNPNFGNEEKERKECFHYWEKHIIPTLKLNGITNKEIVDIVFTLGRSCQLAITAKLRQEINNRLTAKGSVQDSEKGG